MSPRQTAILRILAAVGPVAPMVLRKFHGPRLGNPSQPALSQSLRIMRDDGLVVTKGSGRYSVYMLSPKGHRVLGARHP